MNALTYLALLAPVRASLLCRNPEDCGIAEGICGHTNSELAREDAATICIGFQSQGDTTGGQKALFDVRVDHYTKLSVDALRALMSASWAEKEPYSHVWVGLNGRRTIGQQRGVNDGHGQCNSTLTGGGRTCYGWSEHNKPVVLTSDKMSTGLTAIVHLDMGRINRIVWDSSCNLCPSSSQLECKRDETNITCVGGACSDCYAQLPAGGCTAAASVCAPSVYVAWLGTDKHGQPLLSAGSVLSRFQAFSIRDVTDTITNDVEALVGQVVPDSGSTNSTS